MLAVHLHGALGKDFGRRWDLDVKSPAEAIRALFVLRPGIRHRIASLDRRGYVFRVRTPKHEYDNDDLEMSTGSSGELHITPVIKGSSAAFRFVVGAVMLTIGIITQNPYLVNIGATLMIGAVTEWLTPKPKKEDYNEVKSWTLGGSVGMGENGQVIPVIYGEVLTRGIPVSAGLTVSELSASESAVSDVTIGGESEVRVGTNGTSTQTQVVLEYSAATVNMDEPFIWTWSYSGFVGTTSVVPGPTNTAVFRLTLNFSVSAGSTVQTTGNVAVNVSGKRSTGEAGAPTVVGTDNMNISVFVDGTEAIPGGA